MADGYILVDQNSIIREISQAYCDKLSSKRLETIGRPVNDVIADTQLPRYVVSETKFCEKYAIHQLTLPHPHPPPDIRR